MTVAVTAFSMKAKIEAVHLWVFQSHLASKCVDFLSEVRRKQRLLAIPLPPSEQRDCREQMDTTLL